MRAQAAAEDDRNRVVRDITQILASALTDEHLRYMLAKAIVKGMRAMGHRGVTYIPDELTEGRADRDRAICAEFNGRNYRELGAKHDLTDRQVRRIVSRCTRAACSDIAP